MNIETIRKAARKNAGFTLVELLLVVAILGTLAAVVVVNFAGQGDNAKVQATRTSISNIESALGIYEASRGKRAESLDDLCTGTENYPPLLKKDQLADAWGNPFTLKKEDKWNYIIISPGLDGQLGTEDDITNSNGENKH